MSLRLSGSIQQLAVRILIPKEARCCCSRWYTTTLSKIGKSQEVNDETEPYETGQTFLHNIFKYRGVILQAWPAEIHNYYNTKEVKEKKGEGTDTEQTDNSSSKKIKSKRVRHMYYQVLMDKRDSHIKQEHFSLLLSPTDNYSHNQRLMSQLTSIQGIDYIAHEDIWPYMSSESPKPIQHELFEQFFFHNPDPTASPKYCGQDTLKMFQDANHSCLCLTDVYKITTENIRVTVIPFYMGNHNKGPEYMWRYIVRIENLGEESVRLQERYWKMWESLDSKIMTLQARGVVGVEPKLTKECPAFQYSSYVSLLSPGSMWGHYVMSREDGSTFKVQIPIFQLK